MELITNYKKVRDKTIVQLLAVLGIMGLIAYGIYLKRKNWERLVEHRVFAVGYVSDVFRSESRYHPLLIKIQYSVKGNFYEVQKMLDDETEFYVRKLEGRSIGIIYDSLKADDYWILFRNADYAFYGLDQPDSLKWIGKYFN